jgi:hypothetical protein
VKLSREGDGLSGTIVRVTYFGSKVEYEVKIASASLIIEIYNPQLAEQYVEGDKVKTLLDPDCVRVLRDDALAAE